MIGLTDLLLSLGGLVAGVLVGLTGMGGAVLVTPMLVVAFGLPPATAVSSDLVTGAVVKPVGSLVHARRGTVHWGVALWLSLGSVPGVLVGTWVFARQFEGSSQAGALKAWLGAVLLVALAAMWFRTRLSRRATAAAAPDDPRGGPGAAVRPVATLVTGFVVGVLVGTTSVGSGTLIVTSLLLLYPLLRPSVLVGTDLVQAVPMLIAGALAHLAVGVVDWRVTIALLVGQLPGVWLGARLSSRYNGIALRYLLMVVLGATALRLVGLSSVWCGAIALAGLAAVLVVLVRERRVTAAA